MTTLYKINGEFMTQSEAREHGYTLSPTITINYKSSESATFGQDAGSGLLQGSLDNMINGAFYAGVYEWYGIDNLARAAKKYPATAETVEMKKISDSSISAGAKLLSNDVNYYLIANDLTLGWVAEDDLETNGWRDNSEPPQPSGIDIDVAYGSTVTIPEGYVVESVHCQRLFVFAKSVEKPDTSSPVTVVFDGANLYCDDSDASLIGKGVDPCMTIFCVTSSTAISGYYISYKSSVTPSYKNFVLSDISINSNNSFVSMTIGGGIAGGESTNIESGFLNYAALFMKFDSTGTIIPFYFNIPRMGVWDVVDGEFTWLGDTTNNQNLAYYYAKSTGLMMRIHCVEYQDPAHEEITLYAIPYLSTGNNYYQNKVTSATIQAKKAGNNEFTIYQLCTDPEHTQYFVRDFSKIYKEKDSNALQSIEEMPTVTTSTTSEIVFGRIMTNNGRLWYVNNRATNYNVTTTLSRTYKVYNDTRTWTQHALHMKNTAATSDNSITCYSSPIPTATTKTKLLYVDAECTNKFYPDLDREYRITNSNYEPSPIQSVVDMPSSTGASYQQNAAVLMANGKLHFIKSTTGNADWTSVVDAYLISTPKIYNQPTITLDLGLSYDFTAKTFESNDNWGSWLWNDSDKEKAQNFGLEFVTNANGSQIKYSARFHVELIALCDTSHFLKTTDMSNFSTMKNTSNSALRIKSTNAYSTATAFWRVRITKLG